jgi:hypothetical protein
LPSTVIGTGPSSVKPAMTKDRQIKSGFNRRRSAGMEHVPDAVWEPLAKQWAKSNVPCLERMATDDEIAAFVLVLASDAPLHDWGANGD